MDVEAAASPGSDKHDKLGMPAILRMHELGIFSKDEVRQMVFKRMQMSENCAPIQNKVLKSPAPKPAKTKTVHSASPTTFLQQLQKRKSANTTTCEMRKLAKNTVRQRFFTECLKTSSPLWHLTPGGKQAMERLLFERAASEVLDKLYEENPGALRGVKSQELKQIVHWQVMRDRNNWMGKKPKRAGFFGTMPPFDFEKEKTLIDKALSAATDLTTKEESAAGKVKHECDSRAGVTPPPKCNARAVVTPRPECDARAAVTPRPECDAQADVTPPISAAFKKCFTCGVDVWIDKIEDCPPSTEVAFPVGSSWGAYNVEPYCKKCWGEENAFLQNLGLQYKAVGKPVGSKRKPDHLITEPADSKMHAIVSKANDDAIRRATSMNASTPPPNKRKKTVSKTTKQKAASKTTKQKAASKTTKKTAKKLGGWRGPLLLNENVQRWEVSTSYIIQLYCVSK